MSDRKYQQRGYQESERREKRGDSGPRPQGEKRERGDAPRGRGLGSPTNSVFRCARCGAEGTVAAAASPGARCGGCGADLHTCTNCAHFDTGAPKECREPIPVRIARKDVANECDRFEPRLRQETRGGEPSSPDRAKDPRAAFDALFKL